MDAKHLAHQLRSIGALEDPIRRRLYFAVASRPAAVSRSEAARVAGVSRTLAAFHLDKLVGAGLLETSFRRLTGRSGPGAGRPAKLYARSDLKLDVTLPERRYEWAAQVLASTIGESATEDALEALRRNANARGEAIGRDLSRSSARRTPLRVASHALEQCGYQPSFERDGRVLLRNCPFDSLRAGCRDVTCGMNHSIIEGLLVGLGLDQVQARLAPQEGHCCVELRARSVEESEQS